MVKSPALSILPIIAFRDAHCITHNPVNGTVSQGREGPARVAGCRITLRTPVGIIRNGGIKETYAAIGIGSKDGVNQYPGPRPAD